jgi:hypothetical protein
LEAINAVTIFTVFYADASALMCIFSIAKSSIQALISRCSHVLHNSSKLADTGLIPLGCDRDEFKYWHKGYVRIKAYNPHHVKWAVATIKRNQ